MARPEPSSNRAPGSPPGDASSRRQTSRRYLKGASIPIGGLTSGFPHQGSLGSGGHGVPCGPTMFTKQVSRSMDSPHPEGCIYSDPGHDQQVSLGPFGLPEPEEELRKRPDARGEWRHLSPTGNC